MLKGQYRSTLKEGPVDNSDDRLPEGLYTSNMSATTTG